MNNCCLTIFPSTAESTPVNACASSREMIVSCRRSGVFHRIDPFSFPSKWAFDDVHLQAIDLTFQIMQMQIEDEINTKPSTPSQIDRNEEVQSFYRDIRSEQPSQKG